METLELGIMTQRERDRNLYFVLTIFPSPTSDQPRFVSSLLFAPFSSPLLPSASYSADTRWENDDNKIWHDENVSALLLLKLLTNCWHNNEENVEPLTEMLTEKGTVFKMMQNNFNIKWRRLPFALGLWLLVDSL